MKKFLSSILFVLMLFSPALTFGQGQGFQKGFSIALDLDLRAGSTINVKRRVACGDADLVLPTQEHSELCDCVKRPKMPTGCELWLIKNGIPVP